MEGMLGQHGWEGLELLPFFSPVHSSCEWCCLACLQCWLLHPSASGMQSGFPGEK